MGIYTSVLTLEKVSDNHEKNRERETETEHSEEQRRKSALNNLNVKRRKIKL
jgi:hypothetical protein